MTRSFEKTRAAAAALLASLVDKTLPTAKFSERLSYFNSTRFARDAISDPEGARHPNGGGWVSTTAQAAPTAYIGPNVRVLGEAKVLGNAIIEDYAVIMGNAVVSGNARVGGQAVIEGHTRLGGYQRAWTSLRSKEDDEAPDLTGGSNEDGLWANYAMDQAEACMLEDYYRRKAAHGMVFDPIFNGYLHGRPEFVTDGTHSGFSFDGRGQYAELNRRITDLGEITVDMTVRWRGTGEQALLDCGTGMDNHFTLRTRGGALAFTAIVDGTRVAELAARESLKPDAWTRVRLEIDGEKIALWMDDRNVGEKKSSFRPADVFRPGAPQRSFIAASLDGENTFEGIFDNVVVYHRVHGDRFAALQAPVRKAPRRPAKGFTLNAYRSMEKSPYAQNTLKGEYAAKAMDVWNARAAEGLIHLTGLKLSVPEYVEAVEKAKEFKRWERDAREKLKKDYYAREEAAPMRAELERIDARRKEVDRLTRAIESEQRKNRPTRKKAPAADPLAPKRMSAKAREIQAEIEDLEEKVAEFEALEKRAQCGRRDAWDQSGGRRARPAEGTDQAAGKKCA